MNLLRTLGKLAVAILMAASLVLPALADIHYVWTNSPSPTSPYTNWATAAWDIQSAINASSSNDTVLVTNGVYATGGVVTYGAMTNRVALTNAVTVYSVNGPLVTIIKGKSPIGNGAVRCAYVGSNSVLVGFTLTNGATRSIGDALKERCGGGVWCESSATVSNCTLSGNSAGGSGGGSTYGTLNNCTLSGNSAGGSGGGSYFSTLRNCNVSANSAVSGGGGVFNCTLNNCLLSGNTGSFGGGSGVGTLNNCTLTGNSAYCGGGAYNASLYNCIAYYNTATVDPNYSVGTLSYCCTTPDPGGAGNITNDPRLVSAARIAVDSLCVGSGNPVYASGVDIDGEPWHVLPSIGVDEPYMTSTGTLSVAIGLLYTQVTIGFQAPLTAMIDGHAICSKWDFGDNTAETNRAYVSHAWAATGSYSVVLSAFNEDHTSGVSCTAVVSVVDTVYYVNGSNATPAYPYTSWATAATSIQQAILTSATGGRLVLVTNGVYQTGSMVIYGAMANRIALINAATVRSVNGSLVTIIKGDSAVRCAYVGPNSVLAGFTLTNGSTRTSGDIYREWNGGGIWCEAGGLASNCWIVGNSAYGYGGGSAYGTLNNCTLSGNSASGGGGSYFSTLNNSTLSGNSAGYGGGSYNGTLNNCIFVGNSGTNYGGGAYYGTLNNCTIVGNSSGCSGGAYCSTLNNCISYYNTAPNYCNDYDYSTIHTHCCTTPLPTGTGNIADKPGFVNTNGWRDLRLAPGSLCINVGTNACAVGLTDLDNRPRVIGGVVDMGAYESTNGATTTGVAWGWLLDRGWATDDSADALDPDGDGMQNWQEYLAGTDPTNRGSYLGIVGITPADSSATGLVVRWSSVAGKQYRLDRATNLVSWASFDYSVQTNIPATPLVNAETDTTATAKGPYFYRIGVE